MRKKKLLLKKFLQFWQLDRLEHSISLKKINSSQSLVDFHNLQGNRLIFIITRTRICVIVVLIYKFLLFIIK